MLNLTLEAQFYLLATERKCFSTTINSLSTYHKAQSTSTACFSAQNLRQKQKWRLAICCLKRVWSQIFALRKIDCLLNLVFKKTIIIDAFVSFDD
jgi:hypothetical protein